MKKLNVKLLERVKKAILKHPENTFMDVWVRHTDGTAPCGTVGCIAGWTIAEANLRKLRKIRVMDSQNWGNRIQERARKLLGINKDQSEELFVPDLWPIHLKDRYYDVVDENRAKASKVIARRIDDFIKENKA